MFWFWSLIFFFFFCFFINYTRTVFLFPFLFCPFGSLDYLFKLIPPFVLFDINLFTYFILFLHSLAPSLSLSVCVWPRQGKFMSCMNLER